MLPTFAFSARIQGLGIPDSGELEFSYGPFLNLINPTPLEDTLPTPLVPLRLGSYESGINVTEPLSIETEVAYDDSVNLVITDQNNSPKIVNSRFYLTDSTHYKIADRKGTLDTNIYSKKNFKIEASLIQTVSSVAQLEFLGVKDGGRMKIGSYTFYFKLADADGNETDFISESGKVVCHIGSVNNPSSIRGGLQDEDSNKLVRFILKNIDLAYDYIHIYYTRTTGDESNEITTAYRIIDRVKVNAKNVNITITGYENHEPIGINDINIQLVNFESAKTIANCQNITFLGNSSNNYELFTTLEQLSLLVTPQIVYDVKGIGNLNSEYNDIVGEYGFEYYNAKNIYYKLGYWNKEIYRFGIVYILPDNTLSPVFNIRGIKELKEDSVFTAYEIGDPIKSGEDYLIRNNNFENVKGVFKITSDGSSSEFESFSDEESIKPLGIKFNFTGNVVEGIEDYVPGLKHLTKGFFIVRQKRIPTILAQGVGIATSSKSYLPLFKGSASVEVQETGVIRPPLQGDEPIPDPSSDINTIIIGRYFMQSFLQNPVQDNYQTVLGPSVVDVGDKTITNALLCPEASLRSHIFENVFNSSEFTVVPSNYQPILEDYDITEEFPEGDFSFKNTSNDSAIHFSNLRLTKSLSSDNIISKIVLVRPGVDLIALDKYKFSSKAGDAVIGHLFKDPIYGDYQDSTNPNHIQNGSISTSNAVRGEFNSYLGLNTDKLKSGNYYNIMEKNYDFDRDWKQYFLIRYNNSSPYSAVSDRYSWDDFSNSVNVFRGDCYINTYTHRMNWNFIDPELPTNTKIIDKYTWSKHIRIISKESKYVNADGNIGTSTNKFNRLLPMFTYRSGHIPSFLDEPDSNDGENGLVTPEDKKFKKYSDANGLFGFEKLNRPDVNAVPLGIWVTVKVCSNINLAMRDIDFTRPDEEAIHKVKRGFYPYQDIGNDSRLPESNVINAGISKTVGNKMYFEIPDVPFIKTNFATRISYSNVLRKGVFDNGNRVFEAGKYIDYSREYGAIVKLIEWRGRLIAVMEHGVLLIPVNERTIMPNETGQNVSINTSVILPQNPMILSSTFGSIWPESIVKTSRYIYGIDTVAKKIWRTDGESFDNISDIKIQKFLNDKILIKEIEKDRTVNVNFVKAHYDAGKYDIIFTFKYGEVSWSLCWNELTSKWVTQYTWFPEFSENINNIFCTFANQEKHSSSSGKLYHHRVLEGFGQNEDEPLLPSYWYDTQYPFELEFVVGAIPGVQKIFNNLKIISNLAEPYSFYYEVSGDSYDFSKDKKIIRLLNDLTVSVIDGVTMPDHADAPRSEALIRARYKEYLKEKPEVKKLPWIYIQSFDINDPDSFFRDRGDLVIPFNMSILKDINLRQSNKSSETFLTTYQRGSDIKKYGRLKGNMQYLEDSWNIQIQPLSLKYGYIITNNSGRTSEPPDPIEDPFRFTDFKDMDIRDKYIKIRVKYKGDQLVIINALKTLYTISYA